MRLIPYRRLLTVSLAALVTFSVGLVAAVFQWNKRSNARELIEIQVQLLSMYFDQSIGSRAFAESPPSQDWDGIYRPLEK